MTKCVKFCSPLVDQDAEATQAWAKLPRTQLKTMLEKHDILVSEDDDKNDMLMMLKKAEEIKSMNPDQIANVCRSLGLTPRYSADDLINRIYMGECAPKPTAPAPLQAAPEENQSSEAAAPLEHVGEFDEYETGVAVMVHGLDAAHMNGKDGVVRGWTIDRKLCIVEVDGRPQPFKPENLILQKWFVRTANSNWKPPQEDENRCTYIAIDSGEEVYLWHSQDHSSAGWVWGWTKRSGSGWLPYRLVRASG